MARLRESYGNLIPEGEETGVLVEVTKGESRSGNPVVTYKISLLTGPAAGRAVYEHRSLQPQALWRLGKDLVSLNAPDVDLPEDDAARAEAMVELARGRVGARVRIRVTVDGDFNRFQFLSVLEAPPARS